jgi:phosphate transport system permease protein
MTSVDGTAGGLPVVPPSGQRPNVEPVRRRLANWFLAHEELGWRWSARVAIYLPLAALVFAVAVLAHKAWPAVRVNGWYFLTGKNWTYGQSYGATVYTHGVAHAAGAQFGAWPIIAGTLQSSLIAVGVALPLSIGAAFALTERMPGWISRPLGFAIEILAGIPSVVIGLWGLLTFGPWLAKHIYPILASIAGHLPNVEPFSYWRRVCSPPAWCSA